ncbi:inducible alternative oxidase 2 [Coemansia sp. RSA 2706]|nr:inducible alternative oxidase 2 [Coemansia sp. RSA 2706]KAJ2310764.1 inducible alternative oxidase 2 [Coemansia sp. RSA 2705]KAJ2321936.1 inducible alternative oxidase 2 [Coemansia sp. RSA 2704]KAJ2329598.1 inducible alternative oxidase 2 [Coemansia sp. RSA 2702]KAJ2365692.1 inducible alternative oxidase 2 [Coemansia sp. RSA 2610]KAJ2733775.1 inducible alternative oxidase 2 [Coemansia sp. Cherry 401B]
MPGLSHLPATSALLRHACCPAALAPGRLGSSVHARAFGIKTTLKVQERLSKMIKRDQAGKSSDEMQITGPEPYRDTILESMPSELRVPRNPAPMREDTMAHTWTTSDLESIDIGATKHRVPDLISDKLALWAVKSARKPTDVFFRNKYLHRSVMLEVVAAVPGMVGGLIRHIKSLQGMRHDGGWIGHLLHEAENERMHLMTWMEVGKPVLWERALIATVQTGFFAVFSLLYMVSPRTAHRVVGYLEEEAVTSYTHFIAEIDAGRVENVKAPEIAVAYWNLDKDATLRDVVLAVRADEALHRDTNHHFSDRIRAGRESLFEDMDTVEDKPHIKY